MVTIQLLVVAGDSLGTRYTVPENGAIIGRSSKCDFTINDGILSRQHCKCYVQQDKAYVQDLESANGTLVNGEEIGTLPVALKNGDIITLGATVLRLELNATADALTKASPAAIKINWTVSKDPLPTATSIQSTIATEPPPAQENESTPSAAPNASEDNGEINLGLGDSAEDEKLAIATTGNASKTMVRFIIIALLLLIALIVMLIAGRYIYQKLTTSGQNPEETEQTLQNTTNASFDLVYESIAIQPDALFVYTVNFSSSTGVLLLRSENLGHEVRSFEEKKKLTTPEINRLRKVFIDSDYDKIETPPAVDVVTPCTLTQKKLRFVLGHKIWECETENNTPREFNQLTSKLETCVEDLLNIKDAQYSVEELEERSAEHLREAETFFVMINQGDENLRKSYEHYCEAYAYLRTINPKPSFEVKIQKGLEETKALIDKNYDEYKLSVDQAYHSDDSHTEVRALKKIIRLLPESDERYREAEERLIILEERLGY